MASLIGSQVFSMISYVNLFHQGQQCQVSRLADLRGRHAKLLHPFSNVRHVCVTISNERLESCSEQVIELGYRQAVRSLHLSQESVGRVSLGLLMQGKQNIRD